MWQRMGLDLDADGRLRDKSLLTQKSTSADRVDMISNTMIWMLGRLVNLIATCHEEMDADSDPARANASTERGSFLERWLALKHELQIWHDALPPLFQPCTRVPLPQRSARRGIDRQLRSKPLVDHETWHSHSMCASTMQSWHMSQIMLLLHKPPSVSVRQLPWISKTQQPVNRFPDTLADFNQMNEMLQYHSVEICAIALSRPEEATRIHMLQPLYMAGRCLTDVSDRRTVVRLIDGIEDELGWHAKYRADALLAEWDMSRDTLEYYYETA